MKYALFILIRLYQKTLSPDHGIVSYFFQTGACIYRPTCSQYAYDAVSIYGAARGLWLAGKRISRCHPWAEGGYDPLENIKVQMPNIKSSSKLKV